ncbi:MAG: glycosyl hydrolase [Prolixibacteraceae bacterium]
MKRYKTIFIAFISLLRSTAMNAQNAQFEAENAQLIGTSIATQHVGYSGSGYVNGFDNDGDKVVFTFDWETTGNFQLYIGFSAPSGNKNNYVYVNGANIGNLLFANTSKFTELNAGKISLNKGSNTIAIEKSWGWIEVDYIRIGPAEASAEWNISTEPINPKASAEAVSMKKFLVSNFGKTTFAGQFQSDDRLYTESNSDIALVKKMSGKFPAVYGNDLIDYSPSRVAFGASSKAIEDVIAYAKNMNGMITLSWHWNAPTDLPNTDDQPWWSGFYTRATNFDIADVLAHPESEKYELLISDIDAIAVQLKKLQAEHIPVLWRPLHEAEGAWFWWGAKGPEACVELWHILYDRITNYHQINNLLWVWTTTDSPSALDWYPGDEYVDILGVDVYLSKGDYGVSPSMFDNLRNLFDGKKLLTMSENGTIPDPDQLFTQEAYWSYFCTWVGDFISDGEYNTAAHINSVFNHENITTADELPDSWDTFVGINELNLSTGFKDVQFFPVPFSDQLNFRISDEWPQSISIMDPSGKIIRTILQSEMQDSFSVSMKAQPSGIYLIQIQDENKTETRKALKY